MQANILSKNNSTMKIIYWVILIFILIMDEFSELDQYKWTTDSIAPSDGISLCGKFIY